MSNLVGSMPVSEKHFKVANFNFLKNIEHENMYFCYASTKMKTIILFALVRRFEIIENEQKKQEEKTRTIQIWI
jgi:hypothetical protein